MLTAPEPGEDLFMYLSVSEHTISVVLVLVHATRKLPHYFQAHTVYVLTEYPLKSLLKRSDCTGRIAKWGTRLGSFDIRYKLRSLVKC